MASVGFWDPGELCQEVCTVVKHLLLRGGVVARWTLAFQDVPELPSIKPAVKHEVRGLDEMLHEALVLVLCREVARAGRH